MSDDQTDSPVLCHLRCVDARLERLVEDVADTRQRMTTLTTQVGGLISTKASHYAVLVSRLDRYEQRLDRIERRLDLVGAP